MQALGARTGLCRVGGADVSGKVLLNFICPELVCFYVWSFKAIKKTAPKLTCSAENASIKSYSQVFFAHQGKKKKTKQQNILGIIFCKAFPQQLN